MTARSCGISDRWLSTSSAGTRTAPGSFVSASPQACGLRVSTNVNCSPLSMRSLTSSIVTLVASMILFPPFVMFVVALGRQARLNPIGFSACVVFDVRVSHRRQFTGGRFRGMSGGTCTVNDYLRALVRQETWREITHTVGREVDRARQVLVPV